ncbi:MAG: TonB family protein, partial [Cyanobacteria bacterium P01_D01_bin.14]
HRRRPLWACGTRSSWPSRCAAPPLATAARPGPTREVAAADAVAVQQAIATENGSIIGQGAVGESTTVGLVPGSGTPVEGGNRINLPQVSRPEASEPPTRPREPVQEVSLATRRQPSSRWVSCNPCSAPDYPLMARREEIEGKPIINAIFDAEGRVVEAVIEVSSGNAAFDQAALEEARANWRFQDPRQIGGQVSVEVTFVVEGSEQHNRARREGEVRAINLPNNQTIRRVTPDAEPAQSNLDVDLLSPTSDSAAAEGAIEAEVAHRDNRTKPENSSDTTVESSTDSDRSEQSDRSGSTEDRGAGVGSVGSDSPSDNSMDDDTGSAAAREPASGSNSDTVEALETAPAIASPAPVETSSSTNPPPETNGSAERGITPSFTKPAPAEPPLAPHTPAPTLRPTVPAPTRPSSTPVQPDPISPAPAVTSPAASQPATALPVENSETSHE